MGWRKWNFSDLFNPFVPSVLNIVRLTKISNLIRDPQKNFLWASRQWVGRRKEPILSYVTKNDEKKNPGTNGLITMQNVLHFLF